MAAMIPTVRPESSVEAPVSAEMIYKLILGKPKHNDINYRYTPLARVRRTL